MVFDEDQQRRESGSPAALCRRSLTSARNSLRIVMKRKETPVVVRSMPYWANPPEPGQDLNELDWGVMEVLSDGSMRFIQTDPDPQALEQLIRELTEDAEGRE